MTTLVIVRVLFSYIHDDIYSSIRTAHTIPVLTL